MKKLLIAIVALALILIAAIFAVDSRYYAAFVEQFAVKDAARRQVELRFEGSHLYPPFLSYDADKIQANFLKALTTLEATNVKARIGFWALVTGKVALTVDAGVYNGQIHAEVKAPFWGNSNAVRFKAQDLDIGLFPPLRLLGVTAGRLSADAPDMVFDDRGESSGSLALAIKDFSKPGALRLPPQLILLLQQRSSAIKDEQLRAVLSLLLQTVKEIPALPQLNFKSHLKWSPQEFIVESLDTRSSWGEATGTCQFKFMSGGRKLVDEGMSDFTIRLTSEGSRLFGPFLPLISGGALDEKDLSFRIEYVVTKGSPNVKYTPYR